MLKQSLQLKLGQSLTMTPQLQQAIRLLQMPTLELQAHLAEVLESNVMLEQEEPEAEEAVDFELGAHFTAAAPPTEEAGSTEPVEVEVVDQPWADRAGTGSDAGRAEDDEDRPRELADERGESLREHLLGQLTLLGLSESDLEVAAALVDALDDDGYLTETFAEVAEDLARHGPIGAALHDEEEIERVLLLVQKLDPVGVGARDLGECLQLQLSALTPATPGLGLARRIVDRHLKLLAHRDLGPLRRALEAEGLQGEDDATDDETLVAAVTLVRACHPKPGSLISALRPEYIVPDAMVRRTARGWSVELNGRTLPRLRVNNEYAGLIGQGAGGGHAVLRSQLQEARWLLKSLEIRHDTLLKVARAVVERQSEFLAQGEEHMKPMILKDIAAAIGMHESTVSRVTSGKYLHTPRGVFELRYFFSSQVEGDDGAGTSSTAIRAKIRRLITDEPAGEPLSDGRLAELLSAQGIPVARRTVAKYREAIGIASSAERKRDSSR
jgi:RNA polymerase sigma-54 factor